ncbi:uncharacterized protein KGF55_001212 [Candida pseudojiufengensis]|uniref:uncharacterized protein n=1 Tax=Candida pseudojiufengensis TaxID=497109 RepID=UPI0022242282|nr:uncharacterized protein KGF55_001212 [Candida pseudojiufengensis]KAI5965849.1 hypothetical protein KGF55_001212 [Candida pseudojiufengensis]
MKIFLELPKEILFKIVQYINDQKLLEELLSIPELQQLVLRKRYYKFQLKNTLDQLNKNEDGVGDIAKLISLYENYGFKPARIIADVTIINQLFNTRSYEFQKTSGSKRMKLDKVTKAHLDQNNETASYKDINFEVLLPTNTTFDAFKGIMEKMKIVGLSVQTDNSNPSRFRDDQKDLFLDAIKNFKLESLETYYVANFQVQFPVSLKKLTLKNHSTCENLNLSSLIHLENFKMNDCTGINSLRDLQLSKSIKFLKFELCDMATLGDLTTYNKLNVIEFCGCINLIDFVKCSFPNSMQKIIYSHDTSKGTIPDLIREVRAGESTQFDLGDFTEDGIFLGVNFKFPSKLKVLTISNRSDSLTLGSNLNLKNLNTLVLDCIRIDLIGLLLALPTQMFEIIITSCHILKVDTIALFPESEVISILCNTSENSFKTNLNGMKGLRHLEIACDNEGINKATAHQLMSPYSNTGNSSLELYDESRKEEILVVDLPNVNNISLENLVYDRDASYNQIDLTTCGNLKWLELTHLTFHHLNLDNFPDSLEVLSISEMKIKSINGNFGKFNNLKTLELVRTEITDSMLVNKTFPASLEHLNLSVSVENLSCLNLRDCIKLRLLFLDNAKPSKMKSPLGAIELRDWFLGLVRNAGDRHNRAILTNYAHKTIFEIFNGVEVIQLTS